MDRKKRKRLEAAGWQIGSTKEFLGLSEAEEGYIEIKLALSERLRSARIERGMSQNQLAEVLGSSQSRVAKMESSDSSVSVDLLLRSLLAAGASRHEIAQTIARDKQQKRNSQRPRR